MLESVGIPDRDHQFAHTQRPRVAELGRGEIAALHPEDGQVGLGIVAHQLGPHRAAVR